MLDLSSLRCLDPDSRLLAEMLVLQVMDESVKRGITGEISMTLEDNFMINRFIEALGTSRYKTYRIYRKQLPC